MAEPRLEIRCNCGEWHPVNPNVTFNGAVLVPCPSAPPGFLLSHWGEVIAREAVDGQDA